MFILNLKCQDFPWGSSYLIHIYHRERFMWKNWWLLIRLPENRGGWEDGGAAQAVAGESEPGHAGSIQLWEEQREDRGQQTTLRDGELSSGSISLMTICPICPIRFFSFQLSRENILNYSFQKQFVCIFHWIAVY